MSAPRTCGSLADYLHEAQSRGAVPAAFRLAATEHLTGGRTGARVTALRPGYVLKVLPRVTWRSSAMQIADAGEGPLWLSGATRELPAPLECPTVDVALHTGHDEWWVLMRDVSAHIRPRGGFTESDERTLLAGLARLHAHYWGGRHGLHDLPLPPAHGPTTALAEPAAFVAGRAATSAGWVAACASDFAPLRALLPTFLEMLSPADADFFLQFTADRSWHRGLDAATATLNHGDLRRANIALADDTVCLIDWEFASRAPAACDLQWHWFLQYWAYAPSGDGSRAHEAARDFYVAELESVLGGPIDRDEFRRSSELAWIRALCMVGFCLADTGNPAAPEARQRAAAAVRLARTTLGA